MFSIIYAQNLAKFGGRDFVPAIEIAQILKPGITQNAVTICISRKEFPIPTRKMLGVQMVSIVDYSLYCLNPNVTFSPETYALQESTSPSPARRGPGRPAKMLRHEGTAK